MCGITGIWYKSDINDGQKVIRKMTNVIAHRGPDDEGFIAIDNGNLFLGHRRLSIIDLSKAGMQPMQYMERYTITYNGEIYNYLELRTILQSKGYCFKTSTDTEVIMAAYNYWGIECLQQFDGMFAFAIYDNQSNELFCARDRFGVKPFYYYECDNFFAFSSEMKSLWTANVDTTPDDYSIYLFINMNLHEDPNDKTRTFYRNIKCLQPAHFIKFKIGQKINQKQYWQLQNNIKTNDLSFEEACQKFRQLFEISILRRLRSDVSVGTSLSGGIDSSSIVLLINNLHNKNNKQKSFSARFDDKILDEGYFMNKVIEVSQIEHIETWPNVEGLIENLEKIMYHQEEPFGGASIYAQWEVFRLAKENKIKVILDGQGADEILSGYTHFFAPFFREIYKKNGYKTLQKVYNEYLKNNIVEKPININLSFKINTLYPFITEFLFNVKRHLIGIGKVPEIHPDLHNAYKKHVSPFIIHQDLNSALYHFTVVSGLSKLLRFSDRNSMAHSIEVRLPFLYHELVEFVFALPSNYKIRNGWTKALLRYSVKDIIPSEIIWRKNKIGFAPPINTWEKDKKFIEYAQFCKEIAVQNKYISEKSNINWKVIVIGAFLHLISKNKN